MNRPTVRIIVLEPSEWNQGSLFGEILSDRGGDQPKIKLAQSIKGSMSSSNILILTPLIKNETFKPLQQYMQSRLKVLVLISYIELLRKYIGTQAGFSFFLQNQENGLILTGTST